MSPFPRVHILVPIMDGRARRPCSSPPFTQSRNIPVRTAEELFSFSKPFPTLSSALWLNDLARFRNLSQVLSPGFANAGNSAQPQVRFGTMVFVGTPSRREAGPRHRSPLSNRHVAYSTRERLYHGGRRRSQTRSRKLDSGRLRVPAPRCGRPALLLAAVLVIARSGPKALSTSARS